MSKLLIVDDEQSICWGLSRLGRTMGHTVVTASSAEDALNAAARESFDVVILDVRLPGLSGLDAMARLRRHTGPVPIIVMTAHGDLTTAVEAVRQGAFEYLPKPFDLDQMRQVLTRALTPIVKIEPSSGVPRIEGLTGRSPVMQEVFKQLALAAASETSVLLQGETGTGKELAARSIHRFSSRAREPFVVANLAGLTATQADLELFGHASGPSSPPKMERAGLLRLAEAGTLFFDEVADLPLSTQAKLLRALDHHEVVPLGSLKAVPIRCRILTATNHDLLHDIQAGRFRHDLYFHLSTMSVTLPPLRERGEDLIELAHSFVSNFASPPSIALLPETLVELRKRPWYGNVRELRSAIERAAIAARGGTIAPEHLPPPIPANLVQPARDATNEPTLAKLLRQWTEQRLRESPHTQTLYEELLQQVEPPVLQAILAARHNHLTSAAQTLGLHRHTLRKKLSQHGLDPESGDK
jgi:two-component system nitrogen regulation response regulator GlnG